jgi:hypothetical protein
VRVCVFVCVVPVNCVFAMSSYLTLPFCSHALLFHVFISQNIFDRFPYAGVIMELFADELVLFRSEWPVWAIVAMDERKRTVSLERRDEFPVSVVIRVSQTYPVGKTTIQNVATKSLYTFKPGERLIDAIDEALQEWSECATGDDDAAPYVCDDETYSDALVSLSSPPQRAEGGECHASASPLGPQYDVGNRLPQRLFMAWASLAREVRAPCQSYVFRDPSRRGSHFILHLSISIRDIDAFLCLALGLQSAEFLTVAFEVPLHFPTAAPTVTEVILCNYPDMLSPTDKVCDNRLGVFGWYLTDRLNRSWQEIARTIRRREDSEEMCLGAVDKLCEASSEKDIPNSFRDNDAFCELPMEEWQGECLFLSHKQLMTSDEALFQRELNYLAHGSNLLIGFSRRFHQLIIKSTTQCFVCGDALAYPGIRMAYCTKELCTFSVERIGLGVDVLSEITKRPEVFELLMLFTYASAANADKRDLLNPMCNVDISHRRNLLQTYRGPTNFYIDDLEKKGKNIRLIIEVIQMIPSIASMRQLGAGCNDTLRRALEKLHPLLYPFVQWIVASNRSHVQFIPTIYHVRGLGPHQYLLLNHNAEKEQRFRQLKLAAKERGGTGSFFAWHGSSTGNWHCILREGLRVYSGTKFMSSGQVYGSGIYLAKSIATSLPYMGSSKGIWCNSSRFTTQNGCTVLALCEVVSSPLIYTEHNNDIITVSDEASICTRFVCVFHGSHGPPASVIHSLPSNDEIAAQLSAAFSCLL